MKSLLEKISIFILAFIFSHVTLPAQNIYTKVGNVNPYGAFTSSALNTVNTANDLVVDKNGDIYFSNTAVIKKKSISTGKVSILCGSGVPGYGGDNGPAIDAKLGFVIGLALDTSSNLIIADAGNNRIRMIDKISGTKLKL